MTFDAVTIFALGNKLALFSWIPLILSLFIPAIRIWAQRIAIIIAPLLLGTAYILMLHQAFSEMGTTNFGSITEIRRVFGNDAMLTAGWLHYLAFDLFVGAWIARTALGENKIYRVLVVPCLLLTFLLGPVGLLVFLILRFGFNQIGKAAS